MNVYRPFSQFWTIASPNDRSTIPLAHPHRRCSWRGSSTRCWEGRNLYLERVTCHTHASLCVCVCMCALFIFVRVLVMFESVFGLIATLRLKKTSLTRKLKQLCLETYKVHSSEKAFFPRGFGGVKSTQKQEKSFSGNSIRNSFVSGCSLIHCGSFENCWQVLFKMSLKLTSQFCYILRVHLARYLQKKFRIESKHWTLRERHGKSVRNP